MTRAVRERYRHQPGSSGPVSTGARCVVSGWWWSALPPFSGSWAATMSPEEMNHFTSPAWARGAYLLPGGRRYCRGLVPSCTLAIVTNGVAMAQQGPLSPLRGARLFPLSLHLGGWAIRSPSGSSSTRSCGRCPAPTDRAVVVGDSLAADLLDNPNAGLDSILV